MNLNNKSDTWAWGGKRPEEGAAAPPKNNPAPLSAVDRTAALQSRLPPTLRETGCSSGWAAPWTAAAALPPQSRGGRVTAALERLCSSASPYTAILWAPSMPLRHGDLRHTHVTTCFRLCIDAIIRKYSEREGGCCSAPHSGSSGSQLSLCCPGITLPL